MPTLGAMEIGIIVLVLLVLFGPSQIPKLGRSLGASIKEFRNAGRELTKGFNDDESEKP